MLSQTLRDNHDIADFSFSVDRDTFTDLFTLYSEAAASDVADVDVGNCLEEVAGQEPAITTVCDGDADIYHHLPQRKRGHKYIQNHGFTAQNHCRSTVGNAMSV